MLTDDGARAAAAADTAGEEYQGDYYTYTGGARANAAGANAAGVIRPAPGRPLPPVPVPGGATGAPGQSGHAEAEMDRMVNGVRALQLGESQGTQVESFLLRQLGYFNPRPAGGGRLNAPPSGFSRIAEKTAARSAAGFLPTLPPIFSATFVKISTQCHVRSGHQVRSSDPTTK